MEFGFEFDSGALPNNNPQRQRSAEVGNASYIFDLLLSVINVRIQTVEIVGVVGEG
jgi:predicted helicase